MYRVFGRCACCCTLFMQTSAAPVLHAVLLPTLSCVSTSIAAVRVVCLGLWPSINLVLLPVFVVLPVCVCHACTSGCLLCDGYVSWHTAGSECVCPASGAHRFQQRWHLDPTRRPPRLAGSAATVPCPPECCPPPSSACPRGKYESTRLLTAMVVVWTA